MIWQDLVISIANILFTYSLICQVIYGFRKKRALISLQASVLTTIGLYAMAIAFLTLQLYVSTITSIINGTLWFILFIQSIIYKKV